MDQKEGVKAKKESILILCWVPENNKSNLKTNLSLLKSRFSKMIKKIKKHYLNQFKISLKIKNLYSFDTKL